MSVRVQCSCAQRKPVLVVDLPRMAAAHAAGMARWGRTSSPQETARALARVTEATVLDHMASVQ